MGSRSRFIIVSFVVVWTAASAFAQSADALLKNLLDQNARFASRTKIADRTDPPPRPQSPPVTILACSDSRVPPELIFGQGLGELFVVRTAGNVADSVAMASMEFAVEQGWTKVIMVLGHEGCGAVQAALGTGNPDSKHLLGLVNHIRLSFGPLGWPKIPAAEKNVLRRATDLNAVRTANDLVAESTIIRRATERATNPVRIVVAYYDFTTGRVTTIR